jgi:D-3-phosphoglycerate dehydrogenase
MGRKIFIATTSFGEDDPAVLQALKDAGIEYTLNPLRRRLDESEIRQFLVDGNYEGLLAGLEPLTKDVMVSSKRLKVISRVGVGMDNVDQVAAKELGVAVFNTPGVLTDSVAELTLGLMLSALRKIAASDRKMHAGQWDKKRGVLLKGKIVGIVGFGAIGQRVADLCVAFGAEVFFTDVRSIQKPGARQVSFDEMIRVVDLITLHSSGKGCLIGKDQISLMKDGIVIINTARGALIDEACLLEGLSSGKIGAAALDVFCQRALSGAFGAAG